MSQEEPAWRAELREAIRKWDEWEVEAPLRMQGVQQATLLPHIQAAEERGRREALMEAAEKIRQRATGSWDEMKPLAYAEGREDGLQAAADLIDPAKPEQP